MSNFYVRYADAMDRAVRGVSVTGAQGEPMEIVHALDLLRAPIASRQTTPVRPSSR